MKDKTRNSIIILGVFSLLIFGTGVLWLILSQKGEGASFATSAPTSEKGAHPPLETEIIILHDRVHSLVQTHATDWVEQAVISVDQMIALRKQLDQADKAYAKGRGSQAFELYQEVATHLDNVIEQQQAKKEAQVLAEQLVDALKAVQPFKDKAPTPYQLAVKASDDGRYWIGQSDFVQAVPILKDGLNKIDEIRLLVEALIKKHNASARDFLSQLAIDAAKNELREVFALDHGNETAQVLWVEAEQLQALIPQLEAADNYVQTEQYSEAIRTYQSLIAQYPRVSLLAEKLEAAQAAFIINKVQPLVEEAQALFQKGHLEQSLSRFQEASQLAPEDGTILQAIALVEEAIKVKRVEETLALAYQAYQSGAWKTARKLYEEVLTLDPSNSEAQEGKQKATRWLVKTIEYNQLMASATADYRLGKMASAITSFNRALKIKPADVALNSEQEAIRLDLQRQNKPLNVIFKSDNKSYISIIGKLPPQRFKNKELSLYPNVYKIKAQRKGYKTIEKDYKINAKDDPITVVIKCTEKL